MRDLLLARIEISYIRSLAKRELPLGDLPEATFLQKTNAIHGATTGLAVGGVAGIATGILVVLFPPGGASPQLVTVLIAGVAGAVVFGAWVASMAGTALPNSQLRTLESAIDFGAVLMMVDLPFTRVAEIRKLVTWHHLEAISGGTEPAIPAFPRRRLCADHITLRDYLLCLKQASVFGFAHSGSRWPRNPDRSNPRSKKRDHSIPLFSHPRHSDFLGPALLSAVYRRL